MTYKFEQLEVWQLALDYIDSIYRLAEKLPRHEEYNLKSQIIRAATSIALNIAEGSQGQTDPEQARFLGFSIRSLIETVACQHLIRRRKYLEDEALLDDVYMKSQTLVRKLQAFRNTLSAHARKLREESADYLSDYEIIQ
jgi:four helix bundle protein